MIAAALLLAQCVSSEDDRFQVGQSPSAFVVIGVAEAAGATEARYTMLWRQVDASGAFTEPTGRTAFEAETNSRGTVRVRGVPGEFRLVEVEPGVYALDSVFGVIRERRVNYIAQGVIEGPERPAFEVAPGEAVYLGIWQATLEETRAVARPWRLSETDMRAVRRNANAVNGPMNLRETHTRSVTCAPRRLSNLSQREIC